MQQRYDEKSEKGVIGAAILYPQLDTTVEGKDFYAPIHEHLWAIVQDERNTGRPVTIEGITQRLIANPIRGMSPAYLQECLTAAPSRANVEHISRIVTNLARIRRMAQVGAQLVAEADTIEWDAADNALDEARKELDGVLSEGDGGIKLRTFHDVLIDAIDEWDPQAHKVAASPTGWSGLDAMFNGGWRPGQVTTVGARPAVGKSVVASCAAVAAQNRGVMFFSLEMSEIEVAARMSASAAAVNLASISGQGMNDLDWQRISRLVDRSQGWRVFIEEKSRITMAQIRATVRSATRTGPIPLVIIDYAQLVTPADRTEARERQVSRILEDCKHLAKEFNTHVLALAQVNRGSTQREDKRPTMSDLRESGGIEAHSDNIILLHREPDQEDTIEFIVAKNRHGRTGTLELVWRPHFAAVNSMASEPADYRHGMESA